MGIRVRKMVAVGHLVHKYDEIYAPFIREATLRVTMTLRSEGHGGDPSPKLCASVTAVYLSVFVFGRVLTRLDG